MKDIQEEKKPCNCYGCKKKSLCNCSNCIIKKNCKTTFCVFELYQKKPFECNICFSKFRTSDYLKQHIIKTKHWQKTSKRVILPKAKWIDLYFSGSFENDIQVKHMTNSKVLRYKKTSNEEL